MRMTVDQAKKRADAYAKAYNIPFEVWKLDSKTVLLRATSLKPPAPKAKLVYETKPQEKPGAN